MEKIWLKHYPPGVPAEINPDAKQSLVELFIESCQRYHDLPAFCSLGITLSYQQLYDYSQYFAAYLQQTLRLQKGDRLAIMLPNILQYPIAFFATLLTGAIVVNVNPLYTADELIYQLKDAGAETIVVLDRFAHVVTKAMAEVTLKNVIIARIGDCFPLPKRWLVHFIVKYIYRDVPYYHLPQAIYFFTALAEGKKQVFHPVSLSNRDIALLQYTGGTTGIAKGAMLTHRNLIANIQQADAWFKSLLASGQEVIITALPLYHIFSLMANCLFFIKIGGLNVLIADPRNTRYMVKEMKRSGFTTITGVNTLFNSLVKNAQFAKLDFSSLKLALGGGAAVQSAVAEKWQAMTGSPLLEAYGLTETSPCVTINPTTLKSYNGTVGLPVPSTEVCILNEKQQLLPIGQPGELAVRGPQVMQGYWHHPDETKKVFTSEGWLLTGDIAILDQEGYVSILERKKDMIIVSGFNVYPSEVEEVLAQLPGIREAAVVAMVDEKSGEAVKAFIIKDDASLTAKEVIKYCHEHLTGYKVPKEVEFCDVLPKSNIGKVLRKNLRA